MGKFTNNNLCEFDSLSSARGAKMPGSAIYFLNSLVIVQFDINPRL